MTIVDALLIVARKQPASPKVAMEAYQTLEREMRPKVRRFAALSSAEQDDALADGIVRVTRKVELGAFDPSVAGIVTARSYLGRAVKNCAKDRLRDKHRGTRFQEFDDTLEGHSRTVDDDDRDRSFDELASLAKDILSGLRNDALEAISARYRAGLAEAIDQLFEIAFEQRSTADFLSNPAGSREAETERLKLHQRHTRARAALDATVGRLCAAGKLTLREADRARGCVRLLYSCQPTNGARVGRGEP